MEISLEKIDGEEIRLKAVPTTEVIQGKIVYDLIVPKTGEVYLKLELINNKFEITYKHDSLTDADEHLTEKLNELLVEIDPDEASLGTEDSESSDDEYETPYDPETIRVEPKQFSLRQIFDMIKSKDIDLTPDFQRHLVWDNKRKSRLIESILLRIPLPMFYFAQDEEGLISVVDGLQRLSTIREFMDNELRLKGLEYLEDKCGGKFYSAKNYDGSMDEKRQVIESKYFRYFNMTQITVNVIDPSSPTKLKYDIFRRINTGGKPLNSQEIRNCLASLSLRKALKKMANLKSFKDATGGSIKDVRMAGQELALRFILFRQKYLADPKLNNYSGNIESELNQLTDELSKNKHIDFEPLIMLFDNSMLNAYYLFGSHSFRKNLPRDLEPWARRQQINKALFVSWSVLLSQYDNEVIIGDTDKGALSYPLAEKIQNDDELWSYLTYGTNSKANTIAAFAAAEAVIAENLNIL